MAPIVAFMLWLAPCGDSAVELFLRAVETATRGNLTKAEQLFAELIEQFPASAEAGKAHLWQGANRLIGFETLLRNGPASNRIDLVTLSEAFTASAADRRRYQNLADDLQRLLSQTELFGEFLPYFNLHRGDLGSVDDRIDYRDHTYDTALHGAKTGLIDQVIVDRARARDFLRALPIADDQALVIVHDQGAASGSQGVAVIPGEPQREALLRVLGYAFGGLAAEYSDSSYVAEGLPREAVNVAATDDPKRVPWAHWIEALPTKIGVYEGGAGRYKGVWRPTADGCIMRGGRDYCSVCREAMVLQIYSRVSPIDEATPNTGPIVVRPGQKDVEVEVVPMTPTWHRLRVQFVWLAEEAGTPREGLRVAARRDDRDNPGRGRWDRSQPAGESVEAKVRKEGGREVYFVDLGRFVERERVKPGRYYLTAWVHDTGRVKGEPWVIRDPLGLLNEVMTWEVLVESKGP
ncbi:MAG: M64 family metallopeptidase [Planctomycetota bacterium]